MSNTISDLVEKALVIPFHLVTSTTGVVTNLFNLVILSRLGLTSGMSVQLFALAAADLYVTVMELLLFLCFMSRLLYPDSLVDLWSFGNITLGYIRYPGLFISNWITTLISLERCLSVVIPFKVKGLFTTRRSAIAVLVICTAFICIVSPMYTVQSLQWDVICDQEVNSSSANRRILKVYYTGNAAESEMIIDSMCALSLNLFSQIILIVCTLVMVYRLKSSSQIRRHSQGEYPEHSSTLSLKERKLVKVASCLAIILTVCHFPRYVNIALRYTVTSLHTDAILDYLVWCFTGIFVSFNYSSNFFVYMILNVKFKESFRQLFSSNQKKMSASIWTEERVDRETRLTRDLEKTLN